MDDKTGFYGVSMGCLCVWKRSFFGLQQQCAKSIKVVVVVLSVNFVQKIVFLVLFGLYCNVHFISLLMCVLYFSYSIDTNS